MLLVLLALLLQAGAPQITPRKAPEQPVPYSHKTHLSMGLKCKNCHTNPDPGEAMGLPAVTVCMGCHRTIKADSAAIKKLASYAAQGTEPPWIRVYKIPDYVFFSHRSHTEVGSKCESCHGPVPSRDVIAKETDISMGGCMDCHRRNKASNDCGFCHEPR